VNGVQERGIQVVTAQQSAARDAAAIHAGTPSFQLMARAGAAAVEALIRHASDRLDRGIAVFSGSGNNGGDAWIVAGAMRSVGVRVTVHSTGDPRTEDATRARALALANGAFEAPGGEEGIVVDGLLGTGAHGAPRGEVAEALARIAEYRKRGAFVLALDVPSGLDATTGTAADEAVPADVSVSFGTLKRGLTINRAMAGAIEVADIGLGAHAVLDDGAPFLLDARAVYESVPPITASAHKGTRGRVTIVGGSEGMAGAVTFAARGALRAGAGLVRVVVGARSLGAVQASVPEATGATWPSSPAKASDALGLHDSIVIGPGLGDGHFDLLAAILVAGNAPVVIDADGLNTFVKNTAGLRAILGVRQAILTPHPAECARLLGITTQDVLDKRFDIGLELARATNAIVVLKGTPTVVSAPDGCVVVAPVGSPALATGGSGDVLAGVAGALLAVMPDVYAAAIASVWAHGTAAERVATSRVRGATLGDVVDALRDVWHVRPDALPAGVLAAFPAVGER
jgi:ADP-dependent NAD(P)H-hydrate dehydratase / NAD(P)H-hydrate epimerase